MFMVEISSTYVKWLRRFSWLQTYNNFINTTFLSTEYPKTDISQSKTQNGYCLRSLHYLYIIVYVRPAADRWLTVMGWRCRGEGCRRSPGRWRRSRRSRGDPCRAAAPGRGVRGRAVEEGGRRANQTRASATQTSWPHIIQLSRLSVLNSTSYTSLIHCKETRWV